MQKICIVILNYNGIEYLKDLIPSVLHASNRYSNACSVLVLDNSPSNLDIAWLRTNYYNVDVVKAPSNNYLFSYNWLLPQLSEDIVILLNNDLRVADNFIEPLIKHFQHDDVFAVSATSLDWEGKKHTIGPSFLSNQRTLYRWGYDCDRQETAHTLFASGGFSAIDRKKFLEIRGFNDLFYPAYCEDLDLGFRAWRQGWRCIFEPKSIVYHRNQGSWGKKKSQEVGEIGLRAELLFVWSSLPPLGNFGQRALMTLWVFYLNIRYGKSWTIRVWIRTWLEWQGKSSRYKQMKATPTEVKALQEKLLLPVCPPKNC